LSIKIRVGELAIIAMTIVLTILRRQALPQSAPTSTSVFAVDSVKLSPPDAQFTSFSKPGDLTYTATKASLLALLKKAYGVSDTQVIGLPKWSETTDYDIVAKPPTDEPFNKEQLEQALQQLLRERLHLSVHHETRETKGYNLVVNRAAAKLQPTKGGPIGRTFLDSDGLEAPNITLEQFCHALESIMHFPAVKDETGLVGSFNIKLKFEIDEDVDPSLPSIFTALQEQLGLKLVSAKVSVDTIVVDQVERVPTAN